MKNESTAQVLNLIDSSLGNIQYDKFFFPDGQMHIKIGEFSRKEEIEIVCRIKSADDLFLLMQVLDVMNMHRVRPHVFISYLMGARMDRIMSFNEPVTASVVINALDRYDADFIVLEVHCSELLSSYYPKWSFYPDNFSVYLKDVICYPDSSACKRSPIGFRLDEEKPIKCSKRRDVETGMLSGFQIDDVGTYKEGDSISVVDDLIDGGGTFCGLAPLLRDLKPSLLKLCVPHAVQVEGIKKVAALYDEVHITNSFENWEEKKWELPKNVFVKDVIRKGY